MSTSTQSSIHGLAIKALARATDKADSAHGDLRIYQDELSYHEANNRALRIVETRALIAQKRSELIAWQTREKRIVRWMARYDERMDQAADDTPSDTPISKDTSAPGRHVIHRAADHETVLYRGRDGYCTALLSEPIVTPSDTPIAQAADTPSDTPAPVAINTVVDLPLESIAPSFGNDRTTFDESALQELAESIRTNGLAQPITVRPVADGKYQLIAGERRFRAHKLIGAPTIRAIVTPMDDNQAAAVMLVENTGRKDLDPIDEARAYARRRDEFKWDEKTIAERAGVGIQTVRNRLALLQLRPDLQDLVKTGTLPIGYAIVIATAGLDNNRQLIALKDLNANPAPSVAWLRGRCSELGQAQAQSDMFDSVLFSAAEFAGVTRKAEFEQKLPADPRKDKAPQDGDTYRAILENQIAFWKTAAAGWDGYGKAAPRDRCLAAMSALQSIVDLMPAHNANGKRYTQKGRDYIVYQAAV